MIELQIERLLKFACKHKMISKLDSVYARNLLLDLLKVTQPYEGEVIDEQLETATTILQNICDYAVNKNIIEDSLTNRELFSARVMGLLMPRPSEVVAAFNQVTEQDSIEAATDWFYKLSRSSNYIQVDAIAKNLYWLTGTEFGDLEITVNLSKPEKDPKDIAAAKLVPQTNYPKCLLCLENVGFAGNFNHPARQNHRVIPIALNGQPYYMQYSPYVYYNEHCIVFNEQHIPMKINKGTFVALTDFVKQLPHYFIGSNADLPIVGGSILTHDHFQGGHHVFPMERAKIEKTYTHSQYKGVKIGRVKWPMSVIRISGGDEQQLIDLSEQILTAWRNYSDEAADIVAYTGDSPHNTITPIVRKNSDGEYEFDLVLRNNRTSEQHPMGIFHPHEDLHHIKKENIGLIEVMGLAVLPGRLSAELSEIADLLTGTVLFDKAKLEAPEHSLNKHLNWIEQILAKHGTMSDRKNAEYILQQEVGQIFNRVLMDAGVYKTDEAGRLAFDGFMNHIGCK